MVCRARAPLVRWCLYELWRNSARSVSKDRKAYHQRYYQKNKKKVKAATRRWDKANPEKRKNIARRRQWKKYGIDMTEVRYNELLQSQGGVCAICHKLPNTVRLAVDHDHDTKKVRGLLCYGCNRLAVSKDRLISVLSYLETHEKCGDGL